MVITTFFTSMGTPQNGLSPTVRIWKVVDSGNTLIVGQPNGTYSNIDLPMTELADGLYTFVFDSLNGYDPLDSYIVVSDGGPTLNQTDRYQTANIVPIDAISSQTIADVVWNAQITDYVNNSTTGLTLNNLSADVVQLRLDSLAILDLIETILKYDANRTKINKTAKTLTVYENDGTTPFKVFSLKDADGIPSVAEVCERVPQ